MEDIKVEDINIKFEEEDLDIMKEYNASRDNIFLVKKIMKKDIEVVLNTTLPI